MPKVIKKSISIGDKGSGTRLHLNTHNSKPFKVVQGDTVLRLTHSEARQLMSALRSLTQESRG